MSDTLLSRFTPSLMTAEALEATFVQREDLANRLLAIIKEGASSGSKSHTVLVGPRGTGKTHLISLIYHRVKRDPHLAGHLVIAWMREEEWGITTFLDLQLRLLRALAADTSDPRLAERLESLYEMTAGKAEATATTILLDFVGSRTLLMLVENIEELFLGLQETGQQKFRAFLQENSCTIIVATTQSLFGGLSRQTSPFFGFFRVTHLNELSLQEAVQLLQRIAEYQGQSELAAFLGTPAGRARVRALHHLSGGNHRVFVIFSQFLTRSSLDDVVGPVLQTLDDLTPYYQARMKWLSPQQRKIVELLCDQQRAVTVKEIAKRCFITQQTASGQLRSLREKGYVQATEVGRDSYYELREPLMRLSVDVKKNRGEPVRLLVDFISLWYSREELQQHVGRLDTSSPLEKLYAQRALECVSDWQRDPRRAACLRDHQRAMDQCDYEAAARAAEELVQIGGGAADSCELAHCRLHLGRWQDALEAAERAIESDGLVAEAWYFKGKALLQLGRLSEGLAAHTKATDLAPAESWLWRARADAECQLGEHDKELESVRRAADLDPNDPGVWGWQGEVLLSLGRTSEALTFFEKTASLDKRNPWPHLGRAQAHAGMGRVREALAAVSKATKTAKTAETAASFWARRGRILMNLGQLDEALASLDRAETLDPSLRGLQNNRALILAKLGRVEEGLKALETAPEKDSDSAEVWHLRGTLLGMLGRHGDSLRALERALELDDSCDQLRSDLASELLAGGRLREALGLVSKLSSREEASLDPLLRVLLVETAQGDWLSVIPELVRVCQVSGLLPRLGNAVVRSVSALVEIDAIKANNWASAWTSAASDREELRLPLRLLGVAARYRERSDRRVLLELAAEERAIVEPLLEAARSRKGSTKIVGPSPIVH